MNTNNNFNAVIILKNGGMVAIEKLFVADRLPFQVGLVFNAISLLCNREGTTIKGMIHKQNCHLIYHW